MKNTLPFSPAPKLGDMIAVPMPHYCVSIRHKFREWPVDDLDCIHAARRFYDQGRGEICTGRLGDYFILYCIPRKKSVPPRRWFTFSGVY